MIILTSKYNLVADRVPALLPINPTQSTLLYIPTAAETYKKRPLVWLDDDRDALINNGFTLKEFTLTGKSEAGVKAAFEGVDGVYVTGGNTFYLLQQMKACNFGKVIREFLARENTFYIGGSAGSVVTGSDISVVAPFDPPEEAPKLTNYSGLGLTEVVILPHWGNPKFEKGYPEVLELAFQKDEKFILLRDSQFVFIEGTQLRIL